MKIKLTLPELNLILGLLDENPDELGATELSDNLKAQADVWFSS